MISCTDRLPASSALGNELPSSTGGDGGDIVFIDRLLEQSEPAVLVDVMVLT